MPAKVVDRDARALAIEDLNPQAPTHLLVMPLEHHATIVDATAADARTRRGSDEFGRRGWARGTAATGDFASSSIRAPTEDRPSATCTCTCSPAGA